MILRRKTNDNDYDADDMDRAKTVVYALVIAAAIMWLGPLALDIDDGNVKDCGDLSGLEPFEICSAPDGKIYRANNDVTDAEPVNADDEKRLVGSILGAAADAKSALTAVMEVIKYALLLAAMGSITILRMGRPT
jgi:hypothetical protein